jgi:hypothetical protein
MWLLPAALWLDWGRIRSGWRQLAGLMVFTVVTAVFVDGPDQVGPLRYPLRLQPFLVLALGVLLVVAWTRFGLARPSRLRLGLSLGWVFLAAVWSVARASSEWSAQVCGSVLVGASLAGLWWLVRTGRTAWLAPVAGLVTLAALATQHAFFPTPPSPQRNAPGDLAAYDGLYPDAVGDVLQVGATDSLVQSDPAAARQLPVGSAWYLTGLSVQNTYTAISEAAYKARYCIYYQGDTCPGLFGTLFSTEPTTGQRRVDLLGVSSLLLVRESLPARQLAEPPPGWRVAERTPYAVLWTRRTPLPGAGSVAWTSPGTTVSAVDAGATGTSFHVDRVPPAGGTVVLRLLDWPGYTTSGGTFADPVDGYLVTVHVPASAAGSTVQVGFHPPGWAAELAAWVLALLLGAGWSVVAAIRRSRRAR